MAKESTGKRKTTTVRLSEDTLNQLLQMSYSTNRKISVNDMILRGIDLFLAEYKEVGFENVARHGAD